MLKFIALCFEWLRCSARALTFFSGVAALLGQQALAGRILGSLQVDIRKNRQLFGWIHPVTLDQALGLTAQHFLDSRKS